MSRLALLCCALGLAYGCSSSIELPSGGASQTSATSGGKGATLPSAAGNGGAKARPAGSAPADGSAAGPAGLDMQASLAAYRSTLYPLTTQHCAGCHSSAGAGQLPLHSDADVSVAHRATLTKVDLRDPMGSRLVQRLAAEAHNCWSDCSADAARIVEQIEAWAAQVKGSLAPTSVSSPDRPLDEAGVLEFIEADRASVAPGDVEYTRYVSLHELYNRGLSPDDMNAARAGLSKILNSTARYAPRIVNPVAIDPYFLVYRIDLRLYWGYTRGDGRFGRQAPAGFSGSGGPITESPERALAVWARIAQGNINAEGQDARTGTFPNIQGFHAEYVEASQLAYTLTRPDVYNEVMNIPILANFLEREIGVDNSDGIDSYRYMTVDHPITIRPRMIWRGQSKDGYYYRSVDSFWNAPFVFYDAPIPQFADDGYSQLLTTPLSDTDMQMVGGNQDYAGNTTIQAQASEVIFALPNGLQAYAVFGAGNQRRVDAFTFIVVDPRRGGPITGMAGNFPTRRGPGAKWRLLNGASCIACHMDGMNRASDSMTPYLDANPGKFDSATLERARQLYPGDAVMQPILEEDRGRFMAAMRQIQEGMIEGTADKNLYAEPVVFLCDQAQQSYGYVNTESN